MANIVSGFYLMIDYLLLILFLRAKQLSAQFVCKNEKRAALNWRFVA